MTGKILFPLLLVAAFRYFNVVSWRLFHTLGNQQLEHLSESAQTIFFHRVILVHLAPWFTPQLESIHCYSFTSLKVRSMPVRKDDEVRVVRGKFGKDKLEGKVTRVYRKKYVIHVERATHDKNNGSAISVGIDPSNCIITKLKLDKSRKAILDRKNRNKTTGKGKGGFSEDAMKDNLAGVD